MSSNWISRMHSRLPLNEQERRMRSLLERMAIDYRGHEVLPVAFNGVNRVLVVDAFLPDLRLVVECWMSESRRANALAWVTKNAASVDVRFARLKEADGRLRCLGLVEAFQAEREEVAGAVGPLMGHADWMAYSIGEMEERLLELLREARELGSGR
jgi:hypothetical protein